MSWVSPDPASRARKALDIVLEGIYRSPRSNSWSFSRLTPDGFPLEFAFNSRDRSIRFTAEVAGPEINPGDKLFIAERKLQELGSQPWLKLGMNSNSGILPDNVGSFLHQIQGTEDLVYGVWLGGRHGPESDSFKLYAEVPKSQAPQADLLVRELLDGEPIPNHQTSLEMIGYDIVTSQTELYFRAEGFEHYEIEGLVDRFGFSSQKSDLLSLIGAAYGRSVREAISGVRFGFSLSVPPGGRPSAISFFKPSWTVFGGDSKARSSILSLCSQRGQSMENYAAASQPLSGRSGWETCHGMTGFVASTGRQAMLSIGLRPPEVRG